MSIKPAKQNSTVMRDSISIQQEMQPLQAKKKKLSSSSDDKEEIAATSTTAPETQPPPCQTNQRSWVRTVQLPCKSWALHEIENIFIFMRVNVQRKITQCVSISDSKIEVEVGEKPFQQWSTDAVADVEAMENLIRKINEVVPCPGHGFEGFSQSCAGAVETKGGRCRSCTAERKREIRKKRANEQTKARKVRLHYMTTSLKRSKKRLAIKVKKLQCEAEHLQKQCRAKKEEVLLEAVSSLPKEQKGAVLECFAAAKTRSSRGRRYSMAWIYECILMRIKSPALYEHIRAADILPLPCRDTLDKYMRKLKAAYGFQDSLFAVLKSKTQDWSEENRHGVILVDEMHLTEGIHFNKSTLKVEGFVDLGEHTPEDCKGALGDHALVVMFQPFRGKWVQSLACFLSKGNVKAATLPHIILEAITLLENAGIRVDGVVCDGATWNRSMWHKFGICETQSACEHPSDESRRLWFLFDWCHLLKCMRNSIYNRQCVEIPEGVIPLNHWKILCHEDGKNHFIRVCPKFGPDHIEPKGYQKMNVRMANEFWSYSVASGMEFFKQQGVEGLQDADKTIQLIKRIDKVADAMNSKTPKNALWRNSHHRKALEEFLAYHQSCVAFAKKKGQCVWSAPTDLGLTVTLNSVLLLADFLEQELGYNYIMTARLNQDTLEQFFSTIRRSAGPNCAPNPALFAQLFRLLSLYNLVKPPKGSNVTGVDNVMALLSFEDVNSEDSDRRTEFNEKLDDIVSVGMITSALFDEDHSYNHVAANDFIVRFLAGFTAKRMKSLLNGCEECWGKLTKPPEEAAAGDALIAIKNKGQLLYPSESLAILLNELEQAVTDSLNSEDLHENSLFAAIKFVDHDVNIAVGCCAHSAMVTRSVIKHYLLMRMFFAAERKTEELSVKQKKAKELRKQSKM